MPKSPKVTALSLSLAFSLSLTSFLWADSERADDDQKPAAKRDAEEVKANGSAESGSSSSGKGTSASGSKPKYPAFSEVLKDATAIEGLIKLYRKDEKLYGEITSSTLDKDLIVLISIARGIGESPILGGMTWGFGDDWIWQFRKDGDRIQVVRRNVRFTADKGSPEARAVRLAYTDSVLFSLPIATLSPSGDHRYHRSPSI